MFVRILHHSRDTPSHICIHSPPQKTITHFYIFSYAAHIIPEAIQNSLLVTSKSPYFL